MTPIDQYPEEVHKAVLIRAVERKLLELFKEGLLNGTVHTCIGQEFSAVAVTRCLEKDDFVVSNHRGHGHYLARTGDIFGLLSEVMGKEDGCAGGIGGSQHLCNHHYLSNGIQGGMTPIASGIAMGFKIAGKKLISVAFIGDGTLGEGILYETLNICSKWELPVLFVVENNGIAQSTNFDQSIAGSIAGRAEGFEITHYESSVLDLDHLFETTQKAVNFCRENTNPVILEIMVQRLKSHSKGDDNRDTEFVSTLEQKDLLNQYQTSFPEEMKHIQTKIDEIVEKNTERAKKGATLIDFEFEEAIEGEVQYEILEDAGERGNIELFNFFRQSFDQDEKLVMIGEDIETDNEFNPGKYGGAFKVTQDLSRLFPGRVRNTPISEAAIVGIGTGLSLSGFKPIVEIMFGDFMTLTFDQIFQHAAKFRRMYNGKIKVPLIIRTPMGGHRGYGPTHSQSIEKHFLGIPDLNIVALNHRISPGKVYETILSEDSRPTLVIENKIVYTKKVNDGALPGYLLQQTLEDYPTLRISIEDELPDCTIVCYGGVLLEVEEALQTAFDEEEIVCEVICPTLIDPIQMNPIIQSVQQSGRLLIVEEGASVASFGSEVVSRLIEKGVDLKRLKRIGNNTVIPSSLPAENNVLPHLKTILQAIKEIVS